MIRIIVAHILILLFFTLNFYFFVYLFIYYFNQDMALGLATAPILYAAQEYPVRNQKTETIHTHTQIKH